MLKPEKMGRLIVIGSKGRLDATVEALYELKALHILDFNEPDEEFSAGSPLQGVSEMSDSLVKLRSISIILKIDAIQSSEDESQTWGEIKGKIGTLEMKIDEEDRVRQEVEVLLAETDAQLAALRPFTALGLRFEDYSGYTGIAVFAGNVSKDVGGISAAMRDCEIFSEGNTVALFVPIAEKARAEAYLSEKGFCAMTVPYEVGDPAEKARELDATKSRLGNKLTDINGRLSKLREEHAGFIMSAIETLTLDVEKAEAPLRFAQTEHSFVIDGWVPEDRKAAVETKMALIGDLHTEWVEPEENAAPVLLRNPAPSRPFEGMVHLFSTPSYSEIDPTLIMAIVFSVFYGFMIGDAGFGIVMILLGYALSKRLWKTFGMPAFRDLGKILVIGGIFSIIFGLFLYGEFFAIPFNPAPHAKMDVGNWSAYLGVSIPIHSVIHKIEDLKEMLVISILAAGAHLGIGFALGMANEYKHDKKHAIAKLGWLLILVGIIMEIMLLAKGTRVGGAVIGTLFPFASAYAIDFGRLQISVVSIGLIVAGIAMFLPAEGPLAMPEVIGLTANVLSYARLAGIAVAKAAIAIGVTKILILVSSTGNIVITIVGGFLVLMLYAMVFVLGLIAAGIQALRLNYVEFFRKFYTGGGTPFRPFGAPAAGE